MVAGHVCGCPETHGAPTGRRAPARMIDDHRAYVLYVARLYQLLEGNATGQLFGREARKNNVVILFKTYKMKQQ